MGFYFRKSVSFGGVRFNFSKSGIGVSAGFKGFRVGTGPRGNYVHMGMNGIYYKAMLTNKKNSAEKRSGSLNAGEHGLYQDNLVEIESRDASEIVDSSSAELLKELNEKNSKIALWPFTLILAVVFLGITAYISLIVALLVPVMIFFDKKRKTTVIVYDIDSEYERKMQNFYDSFNEIIHSRKLWHIEASGKVSDYKRNSGADEVVRRKNINITYRVPNYMKTNVKVPCIPVGKQQLYFFPDRVLIFDKKNVGAVSYDSLIIDYSNTRFIESESVPSDTEIVDRTWRFVNKKGGPDKRFSNNRELPIVLYTQIHFKSRTGLNELIQVSRPNLGSTLRRYVEEISPKETSN